MLSLCLLLVHTISVQSGDDYQCHLDIKPAGCTISCLQRASRNQCDQTSSKGYCCLSCATACDDKCANAKFKCDVDIPPTAKYTCPQRAEWNECGLESMNGYCCLSCPEACKDECEVPNNPPIAIDDSATTDSNTPVSVNVLANDYDPDDDEIRIKRMTNLPDYGFPSVVEGTITYKPLPSNPCNSDSSAPSYYTESIGYEIFDIPSLSTATATLTITVSCTTPTTYETDTIATSVTSNIRRLIAFANDDFAEMCLSDPALCIPVLDNDYSSLGLNLGVQSFSFPDHGIVDFCIDGLSYEPSQPNPCTLGTTGPDPFYIDTFCYTNFDMPGGGQNPSFDSAQVSVKVYCPPC